MLTVIRGKSKIHNQDTNMTRINNRSALEMSIWFIVAATITVSVKRDFLPIASVTAFSVPYGSFASTKSRNAWAEKYRCFHRLPSSTLFAEERPYINDAYTKPKKTLYEKSIKKEEKNKNSDLQRALWGLILTLTIATSTIGGFPLAANAGFGPSSGATTTPPPNLKSITTTAAKSAPGNSQMTDLSIDLDGKKLRILIDSALNVPRLEEFSGQLDDLIVNLRDSITSLTLGDDDEPPKYDAEHNYIRTQRDADRARNVEREEELAKAQNLLLQIERQEKNLIKLQNQPYWFNYFAAFVGSTVSTLIMHPLDTIKTRMQVGLQDDDGTEPEFDDDKPWQSETPRGSHELPSKSGGAAVFRMSTKTAKTIGSIGGLYEGLTGNLFKEVPPSAVYLGVYETVKYALSPKVAPAYLLLVYLVAGAAGETVGSIIRAPAEAVKSLVQSRAKENAFEAAKSVLGTPDGRLNVIRAWSASIGRDVPFGAIQLAAFETIKAAILNNPNIEIDSSTLLSEAVIGAFAGGLGAFVTNPTDVITTRIITQDTTGGKDSEGQGYAPLGVLDMGKKIYDEEGLEAFFVGWTARVGYWAPAISIFLTCYCSVRQAGITYDLFI